MSAYVLWLDSENAKVFKFKTDGFDLHVMHRAEPEHHTHGHKEDHSSEHFFHQIAQQITGASELLIVGPGLAKTHFKSHLDKHHHVDLAKTVLGVETMDHPTDPQIIAAARKTFRTAHLYTK